MPRTNPESQRSETLQTATATPILPPPLKWLGGKRWLVPDLATLYARYQPCRLVEPFCGGLAVALGLQPNEALLNDVNPHLINFYQWIQLGLKIELDMANEVRTYYRCRERFNELIAQGAVLSREAASLFYYLNRTGFNGLCRFNRQGLYNVPFGRYTTIPYRTSFRAYDQLFSKWDFQSKDFERVHLRPDDFVYADPPYDGTFTGYSAGGFSWDDQVRLALWLTRHPGPVVISNEATTRIATLYQALGFRVVLLDAPRRVSARGDRTPARELLALRNIDGRE